MDDIMEIEARGRKWHGFDEHGDNIRFWPYAQDYVRQTGLKGRWQKMRMNGDFHKWVNSDRPMAVYERSPRG